MEERRRKEREREGVKGGVEGEREGRERKRERKERGWMYKALRMIKLSIVYRVPSTRQSLLFALCFHL